MNIIRILFGKKNRVVSNEKHDLMRSAYAPSQGGGTFWDSYMISRRH